MIIYVFNLLFICSVLLVFTRYCKQDDQLGRYYTSKFGVALVTVSLSVVSALRWEVGTDYRNYTLVFNQIYQMTLSEAINRSGEPLFNSFVWIIMKLTGSPQAVFAVFSFLTVGLIVLSLYRYSAFFSLSVYLYVTDMAYYSSFNGVRQWFAAAILFYGYRHFFDNRRRYMVTVFLASLFHISAIVMIPIYYVVRKPFFRKANFLIAMIFVGFTLFFQQTIGSFLRMLSYTSYYNYATWFQVSGREAHLLRFIVAMVPLAVSVILYKSMKNRREDMDVLMNFAFLNAMIMLLSTRNWIFARLSPYLGVFNTVLIPEFLRIGNKELRSLLLFMIIVLYFVLMLLLLPRESHLVPYRTIFESASIYGY